jgi:hypothetical protein
MPLIVHEFVKGAMKRYGRPTTTDEVINYAKDVLPMCVDHVAPLPRGDTQERPSQGKTGP